MINVTKNMMSLETAMIMSKNPYFQPSNRNNLCRNNFMSAKIYAKFKILILCDELREMSIHINLCLKFQKILQINKNRENKCLRYYEYARPSTKISC